MMGRTHLVVGAGVAMTSALALHASIMVVPCLIAGGVGGILPDIDEEHSMISNAPRILAAPWLRALRRRGVLVRLLVYVPALGASALLNALTRLLSRIVHRLSGGHREGTHHLLVWAVLSALLCAVFEAAHWPLLIACSLCAGGLLHLLCDACTHSGIPTPFLRRDTRFWLLPEHARLRTNGSVERLLLVAYVGGTALLCGTVLAREVHAALMVTYAAVSHATVLPRFERWIAGLVGHAIHAASH